jgi:hypothetical protein
MQTSEERLAKFQTLSQVNKIFLLFQKFQTLTEMLFCMSDCHINSLRKMQKYSLIENDGKEQSKEDSKEDLQGARQRLEDEGDNADEQGKDD